MAPIFGNLDASVIDVDLAHRGEGVSVRRQRESTRAIAELLIGSLRVNRGQGSC